MTLHTKEAENKSKYMEDSYRVVLMEVLILTGSARGVLILTWKKISIDEETHQLVKRDTHHVFPKQHILFPKETIKVTS